MEAGATRLARLRLLTVSPLSFARATYLAVGALYLIVVSGATVRLTGSGLGCDNWPRCGTTFLPPKDYHALVEFGNRGVGFAVGLTTLIAAVAALRTPGLPRWIFLGAVALPFTVLAQGILGGITVIYELHPLIVLAHFLLSLLALGLAVVVAIGAYDFAHHAHPHPPLAANWPAVILVPAALALIVTGTLVTAAGPHSGGEHIKRWGLLPDALHMHVGATAIFGIAYLGLVAALFRERRSARTELFLAAGILGVLLAQMTMGDVQWRTQLPWGLVLVHVALASALWAGIVALAARLLLRSQPRLP